jgi:diacylglycerol kinase family enzyme
MGLPTAVRASGEILSGRARDSRKIIRAQDEPWARVHCSEPVDMQADGDYLGEKTEMEFTSVPNAIRLVV